MDVLTNCPVCGATVHRSDMEHHLDWHSRLSELLISVDERLQVLDELVRRVTATQLTQEGQVTGLDDEDGYRSNWLS